MRLSPCGVELVGNVLVESLEEMPVLVEGDLDRGVSEPSLDRLGMVSLSDEDRYVRVSETVERARVANRVLDCRLPDPPAEVVRPDRSPAGCLEHE